jgi:hypothetical protein
MIAADTAVSDGESNMNKIAHGQLTRWQDARSWAEGALARARAP